MKRFCYALDLKDDPSLIAEYDRWHSAGNGWPEIKNAIVGADITAMEIYRTGNRLFMIMEVADSFSFERKAELDAANPRTQDWEELMWKFQQPLPWAKENEKWVLMQLIFDLEVA
ncbi:L-rhamnose mutarotase [Mucilaginibacter sp. RS28]|uniref:L-rhamnose mutarotase n=1 Tax=Mucilaginibacter straminoryzae TaxID=2932774 RepID=A0A9X1X5D9_9SPHI|nr:L-rhamnose mutarotase [Mucilaginibacter straminoryzae]MCJ8208999.1 L-rhamnose mutarotase [Mucilaginibacter straminoryzae]